ncbi:MAG: maleylpyruvate isomerase family mycothiol-dependent enzyme [Nocardioidaceae bacterium]
MSADLDYLEHLAQESDRFAEVLLGVDPMRPVPSCPDWTTVDLFWHLTEVQWFWGAVVRERIADPHQLSATQPERPTDLDSLGHLYATVSTGLEKVLGSTPPQTPVWTWAADQTVGFVLRRQAHEALIHRVDAELTAGGDISEIDPGLATDGVDEVLRVMYGGAPGWATFHGDGPTVRIETTDTGAAWTVVLGRLTGTDPGSGETHDEPALAVVDSPDDPDARVAGRAGDLDRWLWGRLAAEHVERSGDAAALTRLQSVVEQGID